MSTSHYTTSAVFMLTPLELLQRLAELQLMLVIYAPQWIFMWETTNPTIPGELVYLDESLAPVIMRQSTGGRVIPVAMINTDCPIDTDDATWGSVKALYR